MNAETAGELFPQDAWKLRDDRRTAILGPGRDGGWLESLRASEIDAGQMSRLQHSLTVGSFEPGEVDPPVGPDLGIRGLSKEEMLYPEKVRRARDDFYRYHLEWGEPSNPFHHLFDQALKSAEGQSAELANLTSVVGVMRALQTSRVVLAPDTLQPIMTQILFAPQQLQSVFDMFFQRGLRPRYMLARGTTPLRLGSDVLDERIGHIVAIAGERFMKQPKGKTVNRPPNAIEAAPELLTLTRQEFDSRLGEWDGKIFGLSGVDLLHKGSRVLGLDPRESQERIARIIRLAKAFNNPNWQPSTHLSAQKILTEHPDLLCLSDSEADVVEHYVRAFLDSGTLQPKTAFVYSIATKSPEHLTEAGLKKMMGSVELEFDEGVPARERILWYMADRLKEQQYDRRVTANERDVIRSYLRYKPLSSDEMFAHPDLIEENDNAWTAAPRPLLFPGFFEI